MCLFAASMQQVDNSTIKQFNNVSIEQLTYPFNSFTKNLKISRVLSDGASPAD